MTSSKGVFLIKKSKVIKILIAAPLAILATLYAGGYISQFIYNYNQWQQSGASPGDGTSPLAASPDFLTCIRAAFRIPEGLIGIGACVLLLVVLLVMVMRMGYSDTGEYDRDRNFTYSSKGTYGTSGWMDRKEMAEVGIFKGT